MEDDRHYQWTSILKGDKQVFSEFFKEHYLLLYNYGMKLHNNQIIVEDAIQDIFAKIWNSRNRLSNVSNPTTYLIISFRRHLIDLIKSKRKIKALNKYFQEWQPEFRFSEEDFKFEAEFDQRNHEALVNAINQLPSQKKEVIYLHFFNGMDYEEISEIMGLGIPTVRNYMSFSLSRLKNILLGSELIKILK